MRPVYSLASSLIARQTMRASPNSSGLDESARLEAIAGFGRRVLSGGPVTTVASEAAELVRLQVGTEFADVYELDQDGTLRWTAGAGWPDSSVPARTDNDKGPGAQAVLSQAPVIVDHLPSDPRFSGATRLVEHAVTSVLMVPFFGPQRPLGALGLYSAKRRIFEAADVAFAQAIANVLAASWQLTSSDRRRQAQYLDRAEQMLALGQVAAGVAHELRNPLTAIKGLVQVNLRRGNASLPAGDLAVIEHEIRRMERTLQTFLDFARPPKPDRRRLNVGDVVSRVLAVVRGRAAKQHVELRWLPPERPVEIEADQDQLQQLLLNLVLNALDAMPGAGAVTVEVRTTQEGTVELYVRDTGPGIAPHILPKVFETFVSSKETGLGLGIPVSRRIAEDHGGSLSAYNVPGSGACFLLRLPALAATGGDGARGLTGA